MIAGWLAWVACVPAGEPAPDSAEETTAPATADTDATGSDPPPADDVDADGFTPPADCEPYDPAIHPGATEQWNGEDDDCDGRRDGDGTFTGQAEVRATAVVEGRSYAFTLDCPQTVTRTGAAFTWAVVCTPDPDDPLAQQLLGSTLEIHEVENRASGPEWQGTARASSSAGWDFDGTGALRWTSFDAVEATFAADAFSLSLRGDGPATLAP
jgi:hypothetical protein